MPEDQYNLTQNLTTSTLYFWSMGWLFRFSVIKNPTLLIFQPGQRGYGRSGGTLVSNVPLLHVGTGLISGGALYHGHSWYILPGR